MAEFYYNIELNKNQLIEAVIQNSAATPSGALPGQLYYDTDDEELYFFDGSEWVATSGGAGIADGDKGEITVSGTGTVWTIDDGVVTPSKLSFDPATQAELDAIQTALDGRLDALEAVDNATQAELDAHINDTTDAHDASAISITDAGNDFTATDVEGALAELQSDHEADATALSDHIADTTDAHDASAISIADSGNDFTATDVEGALAELQADHEADATDLTNHLSDTTDAHDASAISADDSGWTELAGDDVQEALDAADAAIAGLSAGGVSDGDKGDITVSGSGSVWTIDNGAVTAAKVAADVATQAELDAHVNDTTDAHDASAISFAPNGSIAATDVQAAIQEVRDEAGGGVADGDKGDITVSSSGTVWTIDNGVVTAAKVASDVATQAELDAHIDDTSDAHDASAISIADAGNDFTATDVEGALAELQSDHEADVTALSDHISDTSDAHDASAISFTPNGSIAATDVQAAIQEVRDEASGVSDGDKGDITVSASGATWTIDNGAVTAAKVAADVATQAELDAKVSDTAYDATSWNAVTDVAPSKNAVRDQVELLAPLASPTFTGTPAAPTAAQGTDTTQLATTAFVNAEIASDTTPLRMTINAQTGTTYTPVLSDEAKLVTLSNASAITLTLPQDSDVAIPVGGQIHFAQIGAGQVTFAAGTGATVNSTPGLKCRDQYSTVTAIKRAADTWLLVGDLAA